MNILLVNQLWFYEEFRQLGHRVLSLGVGDKFDIKQNCQIITWSDILLCLPADFEPDLVIFLDDSGPINIFELEKIEVPAVFYSIDAHHHFKIHSQLGLFFSYTFLAQRDYLPYFENFGVKPHWLPLWASRYLEAQEEKRHDAVFVGTLSRDLNPDRVDFFEALQKKCDVEVLSGDFSEISPYSRIVINQTVKRDLNFRVFESMISGAMLLTERIDNGQNELFEDGKHLVLYEKGNVGEAAAKISYYLNNQREARAIAQAGRELVCAGHLAIHRAQEMLARISESTRPGLAPNYFGAIANYAFFGNIAVSKGRKDFGSVYYMEALRLLRLGMESGHLMNPEAAYFADMAIVEMLPELNSHVVNILLNELVRLYPDQPVFSTTLARLGRS